MGIQGQQPLAGLDSLASSHQLERKAKWTAAVRPLPLPRDKAWVKPGQVCSVAGWGKVSPTGRYPDTLQEVWLTVQQDKECRSHLPSHYNNTIQLCVGDPKEKKSSFKVRLSTSLA